MKTARKRQTATISLIEFLRPDGYWCYPYSLEQAFHVLLWMLTTGNGYATPGRWVTESVGSLIGGTNNDYRWGFDDPIESVEDLKKRFHRALLCKPKPHIERWRTDVGLGVYDVITARFPHYKPMAPPRHLGFKSEADVLAQLTAMLQETVGSKLSMQLNSSHAGAKTVHSIGIVLESTKHLCGFRFVLAYGYQDPRVESCDSRWWHTLALTEGNESFLDTFARARDAFALLTAPETNSALCPEISIERSH